MEGGPGGEGDQIISTNNNQVEENKAGDAVANNQEEEIDLEEKVTLQSSDMQTREVVKAVACMSELIKGQLDDADTDTIPLPAVNADTLEKVLQYCEYVKL